MKKTLLRAILIALLASSCIPLSTQNSVHANSTPEPTVDSSFQTSSIAVIVGHDSLEQESLLQVRRLLENKGLTYQVISDSELTRLTAERLSLIIVLGFTAPQLDSHTDYIKNEVENGAGLIWIGEGLPQPLSEIMGLKHSTISELDQNGGQIEYYNMSTQLFNETIITVEPTDATIKGYIIDSDGNQIGPAELFYKNEAAGKTHFFTYDVCSWWFADLTNPWIRAYRLHLAIEDILSEHPTVRLQPFPRNIQSAFITRIEDVDPIHTNFEWINRAKTLLNYYSKNDAHLTVALTPTYIDPELNLNVRLDAPTAQSLRDWILDVILHGGTVVAHGYTHQVGQGKTGISAEFFDDASQTWLSFEAQKQKIQTAANQIYASLGIQVKGFEAPHYVANSDTYRALSESGFEYVTHNSNTAFFDRYDLYGELVNVPETLGYIPTDAPNELEVNIKSNMDILHNMSGVMLYFNHLFDDQMLQTGKNLLDYALSKEDIWVTNTHNLASFWTQRLSAYKQMNIETDPQENQIIVKLGPSERAGLTISLTNAPKIKNVFINGVGWSTFNDNYLILPKLSEDSNTIIISFNEADTNTNQIYGYLFVTSSIAVSLFLLLKTKPDQINALTRIRRKSK